MQGVTSSQVSRKQGQSKKDRKHRSHRLSAEGFRLSATCWYVKDAQELAAREAKKQVKMLRVQAAKQRTKHAKQATKVKGDQYVVCH